MQQLTDYHLGAVCRVFGLDPDVDLVTRMVLTPKEVKITTFEPDNATGRTEVERTYLVKAAR